MKDSMWGTGNSRMSQIFMLDAIVAVSCAIIILLSIVSVWNYSTNSFSLRYSHQDMSAIASMAASLLTQKQGHPYNWTLVSGGLDSSINSLGLTLGYSTDTLTDGVEAARLSGPNVMDSEKIARLSELAASETSYKELKKILGIAGPGYEWRIVVSIYNDGVYTVSDDIGRIQSSNATHVVRVTRYGMLNGTWARLDFYAWQGCVEKCD